jgi:hypothetical protein
MEADESEFRTQIFKSMDQTDRLNRFLPKMNTFRRIFEIGPGFIGFSRALTQSINTQQQKADYAK